MKTIIFTGGGTAGHVMPNLALMDRLDKNEWAIHYIGTEEGIEHELLSQRPEVVYHAIAWGKLRRYFSWKNFTDPFRVMRGIRQATGIIHRLKPNVVFSKGGFVSVPVVYGAKFNGVPVVIASQCQQAEVLLGHYETGDAVARTGATGSGDMTLEATYAKIMFLLSQGVEGRDFADWMTRSIAGEISPASAL